jgi:hypothetical protein
VIRSTGPALSTWERPRMPTQNHPTPITLAARRITAAAVVA